jgi:AcrR family transcriptional regulator
MDEELPEVDLPRAVALAWGVAANPQRGPKRELSIEKIVDAAVAIADEQGLGAVSMSSVASALGFTTMSLYRYVTAKDDLILLMQEAGIGLPPSSIGESAEWRTGLLQWSRETMTSYSAHPWLIDIPILGTPNTPNNLAWMDAALGVLEDTPLSMEERVGALLLVAGQTRWEASIERGYTISNQSLGLTPEQRELADVHIVSTLVTEEAFPHLFVAIRQGALGPDESNPFEFGLHRVLDGIETYMATKAKGDPAPDTPLAHLPLDSHPRDEAVKRARQARRELEKKLREAQKAEREAIARAREREAKEAEKRK